MAQHHGHRVARRKGVVQRAGDRVVELVQPRPRRRGLQRIGKDAVIEQGVAQVRRVVAPAGPHLSRPRSERDAVPAAQHRLGRRAPPADVELRPLPPGNRQAAARVAPELEVQAERLLCPAAPGHGQVDRRLGLVGQPRQVRRRMLLLHGPERLDPVAKGRERPALEARNGGTRADRERRVGDHAEHAFGAGHQLAQLRPGRVARPRRQVQAAPWRHEVHPAHELVHPPVPR